MAELPSLDSSCASLESSDLMDQSALLRGGASGAESTAATNGSLSSSRTSSMSTGLTPSSAYHNISQIHNLPVGKDNSGNGLASGSSIQSTSTSSLNSMGEGMTSAVNILSAVQGGGNPLTAMNERIEQENRVLKMEVDTLKIRIKSLVEENKKLRMESVSIQARAEQEEEFISNTLMKQIKALKREKETLALNYEQEEECLTNDLSRQLNQLRSEKAQLEKTLEQEQEALVGKLMKKIEKLESETSQKQQNLEQLRREKVELENKLEQEQEALVNKLWKRMDKLEAEKRSLQEKIEKANETVNSSNNTNTGGTMPISITTSHPQPQPLPNNPLISSMSLTNSSGATPSVRDVMNASPAPSSMSCCSTPASSPAGCGMGGSGAGVGMASSHNPPTVTLNSVGPDLSNADSATLSLSVTQLRNEVMRLRSQLVLLEKEHVDRMAKLERDEREQRDANLRLQRKLQLEMERREQLCRHLSESESSLEWEEERAFNEGTLACPPRQRTLSSPVPPQMSPGGHSSIHHGSSIHHAPHASLPPLGRPISPASSGACIYCPSCGFNFIPAAASPVLSLSRHSSAAKEKFIKPQPSPSSTHSGS